MNTSTHPSLRRTLTGALLLLAPLLLLGTWLVLRKDLPDPLATHWDLSGTADGFTATGPFILGSILVVLALAIGGVALLVLDRDRASVRMIVGVVTSAAWLVAVAVVDTLIVARGVADPQDAHSGWGSMVLVLLVATGAGALAWRLAPTGAHRLDPAQVPTASYALEPGERATWVGTASSLTLRVVAVVALVASAVLYVVIGPWALTGLPLAILLTWTSSVTARVDDRGVTAHFGALAWPSWHTPLEHIQSAAVEEIVPMKWGGWGYRISRRGTAIVVRGGAGLVLSRTNGSDLAITVDEPEPGAELVNALVRRSALSGR